MLHSAFSTRAASMPLQANGPMSTLQFHNHIDKGDDIYDLKDPVFSAAFGDTVNYATMTAYCLRRFGLPNIATDDYKDLAGWLLTTPHDDVFVIVRPSLSPQNIFSISVMAPRSMTKAFFSRRDYPRDWSQWPDGDPLKEIAIAVTATLKDLSTPTYVRDQYLNAHGLVSDEELQSISSEDEDDNDVVREPYSVAANHAAGAVFNEAPKEMCQLAALLRQLGAGDIKQGIAIAKEFAEIELGIGAKNDSTRVEP